MIFNSIGVSKLLPKHIRRISFFLLAFTQFVNQFFIIKAKELCFLDDQMVVDLQIQDLGCVDQFIRQVQALVRGVEELPG